MRGIGRCRCGLGCRTFETATPHDQCFIFLPTMPPPSKSSSIAHRPSLAASPEYMALVCQLSDSLQTGLSRDNLAAIILGLIEGGASPEAVAAAILELRKQLSIDQ